MDWLEGKFRVIRVINRFITHTWPSCTPNMFPLDNWFWSVCLVELRRSPPTTMEDLITTMEDFKNSFEEQEVRGACRSILCRAQACIESEGGTFEHRLKKARQPIEE